MRSGLIIPYKDRLPVLGQNVFLAPGAVVAGDVHLGENTNLWFNVSMRGDVNFIRIGANTNVQDNAVCHVTYKKWPLVIGNNVTIGHGAILHGCTVEDGALIGMGSKILDGAVVKTGAMVAAGALVGPGKVVESGTLWAGVPAKKMRDLNADEQEYLTWSAGHYVRLAAEYLAGGVGKP